MVGEIVELKEEEKASMLLIVEEPSKCALFINRYRILAETPSLDTNVDQIPCQLVKYPCKQFPWLQVYVYRSQPGACLIGYVEQIRPLHNNFSSFKG